MAHAHTTPLVAILRGLQPEEAQAVGAALYQAGFRMLEVPLNRPAALACISTLVRTLPADALVGGGTMLSAADVDAVYAAGGRLTVSPHCSAAVIGRSLALNMLCAPGIATPTEAFTALQLGAHALKIFPAEMVGHGGLKALASVLPAATPLWPVGGITPQSMAGWVAAGASGFGIGSALFTPGTPPQAVLERGTSYVQAWQQATIP
jgi:2-dehydro-3-deoxyphosphogalactonate aldolase